MKYITLLGILLVVVVAACTAPSQNAPRAGVDDVSGNAVKTEVMDHDQIGDSMQDEDSAEAMDGVEKIKVDMSKSKFEFEGFGPGKSHIGSFTEGEAFFIYENDELVGFEGTIVVDSLETGIDRLNSHLKTDAFFDTEKFPAIVAKSTSLGEAQITGDLTLKGVTKEVTFPALISDSSVKADFIIDTTPFGFSNPAANKEVRIAFEFVIS